jgi:hypothetical protein
MKGFLRQIRIEKQLKWMQEELLPFLLTSMLQKGPKIWLLVIVKARSKKPGGVWNGFARGRTDRQKIKVVVENSLLINEWKSFEISRFLISFFLL